MKTRNWIMLLVVTMLVLSVLACGFGPGGAVYGVNDNKPLPTTDGAPKAPATQMTVDDVVYSLYASKASSERREEYVQIARGAGILFISTDVEGEGPFYVETAKYAAFNDAVSAARATATPEATPAQ